MFVPHSWQTLIVLVTTLVMLQCGSAPSIRLDSTPDCTSSVEGYLASDVEWLGPRPAVVLGKGKSIFEIVMGEMELMDAGIIVDQPREGPFFDPEPKLYPYDDILFAVDDLGTTIHGAVPENYSASWGIIMTVVEARHPGTTYTMRMGSNQKFGFCLPPGRYAATEISLTHRTLGVLPATSLPKMRFTVRAGASNYLGSLHLEGNPSDSRAIEIPYSKDIGGETNVSIGQSYPMMTRKPIERIEGKRYLTIAADDSFIPSGMMAKVSSLIEIVE